MEANTAMHELYYIIHFLHDILSYQLVIFN